jgi:hypothetical protein
MVFFNEQLIWRFVFQVRFSVTATICLFEQSVKTIISNQKQQAAAWIPRKVLC